MEYKYQVPYNLYDSTGKSDKHIDRVKLVSQHVVITLYTKPREEH